MKKFKIYNLGTRFRNMRESVAGFLFRGLLNVGRFVFGRVVLRASCLGASCLWGELSCNRMVILQNESK